MGALTRITWQLHSGLLFGHRAIVIYRDGSINGGDYERHNILYQWFWRKKDAEAAIKKAIENTLYNKGLWRVSEGGQSPVANNYTVSPEITLTTPKQRKWRFDS